MRRKKPSAAENGVLTWNIYGHEFAIKTTQDNFMDDSLIYEETRSVFPYLAQVTYDICPISILTSKLALNSELKDLQHEMVKWKIEHYDEEIKYFRVSLTLPTKDRYIGEGCSLYLAQRNAAYNCLTKHPVLSIGEDGIDRHNYWSELQQRVKNCVCDLKSEIISGVADCKKTMYCRVRLSCFQNGEKLFETTATGISKLHADRRAAKKIIEEPKYGAKMPGQVLSERNIKFSYNLEVKKDGAIIQKCVLVYKPDPEQDEQEYPAEGLNVKHAKAKAAYNLIVATFGPDQSKKQEREITSIKQVKPYNRNKKLDPKLPPIALERGDKSIEVMPDLNEESRLKYLAMIERNAKHVERMKERKIAKSVEQMKEEDVEMKTEVNDVEMKTEVEDDLTIIE